MSLKTKNVFSSCRYIKVVICNGIGISVGHCKVRLLQARSMGEAEAGSDENNPKILRRIFLGTVLKNDTWRFPLNYFPPLAKASKLRSSIN